MASRGVSLVYRLGDGAVRKQLVSELVAVLQVRYGTGCSGFKNARGHSVGCSEPCSRSCRRAFCAAKHVFVPTGHAGR